MKLYCGDCLQILPQLPDASVDMVLADPPYATTECRWDNLIPFPALWEQLNRVCKANAAVCMFSQMPFTATLAKSNEKQFRYEWIWIKAKSTGFLNAKRMPLKTHENILVFYRKLPTYNPQMTLGKHRNSQNGRARSQVYGKYHRIPPRNADAYYPKNVIYFQTVNSEKDRCHPTQKPVPLCEYLISTYTNPGETVLDFCMGSGTCGVAAANTGREFVGIEIGKDYFEIAKRRIDTAQEQTMINLDSCGGGGG